VLPPNSLRYARLEPILARNSRDACAVIVILNGPVWQIAVLPFVSPAAERVWLWRPTATSYNEVLPLSGALLRARLDRAGGDCACIRRFQFWYGGPRVSDFQRCVGLMTVWRFLHTKARTVTTWRWAGGAPADGVMISVGTAYLVQHRPASWIYAGMQLSVSCLRRSSALVIVGMLWQRADGQGGFWGLGGGHAHFDRLGIWVFKDPSALRYVALSPD